MRNWAFVALVLVLLGGQVRPAVATPFTHEVTSPSAGVGYQAALAFDGQGRPHATHLNGAGPLLYSTRANGAWTTESVPFQAGVEADLAVDAQGRPHIAFRTTGGALRYALKTAGVWTTEIVESAGGADFGAGLSIALDAAGNPRISHYNDANGELRYSQKSGGLWTSQFLEATGLVPIIGRTTSLALDAHGDPRIAYHHVLAGLKYATRIGGVWQTEQVLAFAPPIGSRPSLALDASGRPHISFYEKQTGYLGHASNTTGSWTIAVVHAGPGIGSHSSLALDAVGAVHIAYLDESAEDLRYAHRPNGGAWTHELVDGVGRKGRFALIALDPQGNPGVVHQDFDNVVLLYAYAGVQLSTPLAGVTWPVGAVRDVAWSGVGPVDIRISTDGGASYETVLAGIQTSPVAIVVPHLPTRFARLAVHRASPLATAVSESFFTIETSIALLNFTATLNGGGVDLSWTTDPGPADLAGYRLERSSGSGWQPVVEGTRATSHRDPAGAAGDRYRLFAINGLGTETLLGERALLPARPLAAWPLPYRSGNLQVSFAVASAPGGGPGLAEVGIYDAGGRLVRTIARGAFAAGYRSATWDGRDARGATVGSGIYFVRAQTEGRSARLKLVVLP